MQKISDNVLETIKNCKICPKPKWHFLMKNYVIWSAFFVTVILGSLSFSAALHMLVNGDWDIYAYSGKGFFEFCLLVLPIFWLLFLIIFAFLAFYNWKHTRHGYRYGTYVIMLLSIGVSGIFGFLLFNFGLGKKVDIMLSDSMPLYHKSKSDAINQLWLQPDRGLLSGEIVEIKNDELITIEDKTGKKWEVQITQETHKPDCCKKKGKTVRIIGKKKEKREEIQNRDFVAKEIRSESDDESEGKNKYEGEEEKQ